MKSMDVFYAKKERVNLHKSGSVELYIDINYFHKQIELVVADATGEERFLPTDFSGALSRYKELCALRKKQRG